MGRGLLLLVLLVGSGARAAEFSEFPGDQPRVLPHAAHGLFTGDEWRFRHDRLLTGFLLRTGADLLSIPTGLPWWTPGEWALFTTVIGSTAALSAGTPSVDVIFQNFVTYELLGGEDHYKVWGMAGDLIIWSVIGVGMLSALIYGLVTGEKLTTETTLLMFEACVVAQLYHQMIKLLTGRSGPQQPELYGYYRGPAGAAQYYPEGTPSGHMASIYAMLAVLMNMVDHPALWVGGNLFALMFGAALVGDNYHWLSDVTFGAAIGYVVGRWIVRHRSTHFVYGVDPPAKPVVDISVLPLILPSSGAAGFGIVGTF